MNRPPRSWGRSEVLPWARRVVIYGTWALLVLFGILFLLRDALKYVEITPEVFRRFWKVRWALLLHILPAGIALVVGPLQFIHAIRRRWPATHRALGWIYFACGAMSFPASARLALASDCRMCVVPFVLWTTVFFVATALAVVTAVRKNFEAHRQFMIRSYVLLNGFVLVRLDNHFPFPLPEVAASDRPAILMWAVWVVPLILTELWLSWSPLAAARSRRGSIGAKARGPASTAPS